MVTGVVRAISVRLSATTPAPRQAGNPVVSRRQVWASRAPLFTVPMQRRTVLADSIEALATGASHGTWNWRA
jgi:hypothetical protein